MLTFLSLLLSRLANPITKTMLPKLSCKYGYMISCHPIRVSFSFSLPLSHLSVHVPFYKLFCPCFNYKNLNRFKLPGDLHLQVFKGGKSADLCGNDSYVASIKQMDLACNLQVVQGGNLNILTIYFMLYISCRLSQNY